MTSLRLRAPLVELNAWTSLSNVRQIKCSFTTTITCAQVVGYVSHVMSASVSNPFQNYTNLHDHLHKKF